MDVSDSTSSETIAASVVVRLRDDLASVCDVGDVVQITGPVHVVLDDKSCAAKHPALGRFWMEAMGARVLGPVHRLAALNDNLDISKDTQNLLDRLRYGDLGAMLEALGAWACPPLGALGQIALLLSAASAGARGEDSNLGSDEIFLYDPDPECDTMHLGLGRSAAGGAGVNPPLPPPRVNVLVLTQGYDPVLARTLQLLAHVLCAQVTDGGLKGAPLLPAAMVVPGLRLWPLGDSWAKPTVEYAC